MQVHEERFACSDHGPTHIQIQFGSGGNEHRPRRPLHVSRGHAPDTQLPPGRPRGQQAQPSGRLRRRPGRQAGAEEVVHLQHRRHGAPAGLLCGLSAGRARQTHPEDPPQAHAVRRKTRALEQLAIFFKRGMAPWGLWGLCIRMHHGIFWWGISDTWRGLKIDCS